MDIKYHISVHPDKKQIIPNQALNRIVASAQTAGRKHCNLKCGQPAEFAPASNPVQCRVAIKLFFFYNDFMAGSGKNTEIEFKWQARSRRDFERFLFHAKQLGVKTGRAQKIRIRDLYLDTESRYFARAGLKCRLRQTEKEWRLTLKSFARLKKGLARRLEKEIPLPRFRSRSAALRYVNRRLANTIFPGESLIGLFEIKNSRILQPINLACGAKAEACFDQVTIQRGGRKIKMKEIEFEFLEGNLSCFKTFIRGISRASRLSPQKKSKVATAASAFSLKKPAGAASKISSRRFPGLSGSIEFKLRKQSS